MKHLICIALLLAMPFMAFAQEYKLLLTTSRKTEKIEVMGAANGYLYYKSPPHSLHVVHVSSITSLKLDDKEYVPYLLAGNKIEFEPEVLALFTDFPDSLKIGDNNILYQRQHIKSLNSINTSLQFLAVCSAVTAIVLVYLASKAE